MRNKWADTLGSFSSDFIAVIIGILFLITKYTGWYILYLLTVIFSLYIIFRILWTMHYHLKPIEKTDYLLLLFQIGFVIFLLFYPDRFMNLWFFFYGAWMLGHGVVWALTYHVRREDHLTGAPKFLFGALITTLLGMFLLFTPYYADKEDLLSLFAGLYFIIYGGLGFAFHMLIKRPGATPEQRRTWSFTLPVFFTFLLPLFAYTNIRKLISDTKGQLNQKEEKADLHVYLYLKGHGPEIIGHMDIGYKGKIYTYGCHDPEHRKLAGTLGDGVLFVADEQSFLQEHLDLEEKTILAYGIVLTDEEKQLIEERIRKLMLRTIPWKSKAQICEEQHIPFNGFHDYASRIYETTHAEMYKFTEGKFRTYFVTYTNCVLLADELIRNKNLNIIDLSGIVTPGAYLSFLNTEYSKPNSIVVSRTIYAKGIHEVI